MHRSLTLASDPTIDRDIAWLAFNYRVLQEARDPRVALFDRTRFLAIFSSNLDEFFRVRVAALRQLVGPGDRISAERKLEGVALLKRIHEIVDCHQNEFGETFRQEILPQLAERGIFLIDEGELDEGQQRAVEEWFTQELAGWLRPAPIAEDATSPMLSDGALYLAVRLASGRMYSVEIPSRRLGRFLKLPSPAGGDGHFILRIDDAIRHCLHRLFPGDEPSDCHSIKLTRDADLLLDLDSEEDLLARLRRGLIMRDKGVPSRLLVDAAMPAEMLRALTSALGVSENNVIFGARYHGFSDLVDLPLPELSGCHYPPLVPLECPRLESAVPIFDALSRADAMLYPPYQGFDPVLRFLEDAQRDPLVDSIRITLYRTARESRIVKALVGAARRGCAVSAFVEVGARFDEESNIRWAEELEEAGAQVRYRYPGFKVHAKLCSVTRRGGGPEHYAYLSTGNFNEETARFYCDIGMFTTDPALTADVNRLFDVLSGREEAPRFEQLLVAPFNLREALCRMVDLEIENARRGERAAITLKLNGLQDRAMIQRLYEASRAGVEIRLIVRGICCLVPGVPGISENIEAISIVDRFLEHARVYVFHNGGDERVYLASADWMKRNLKRRVEVAWPVRDPSLRSQLREVVELQWQDSVKARLIDGEQRNRYRAGPLGAVPSSQEAIYELLSSS